MTDHQPDPDQLAKFGEAMHDRIMEAPFGSLPKSELELVVFSELIQSKIIDLETSNTFDLARRLRCSPAKASSLVFNYRLRSVSDETEESVRKKLANVTKVATDLKNSRDGAVTLNVEDRFWRNELTNRLKKAGVYTDSSFNRERIVLDESSFFKACPQLFGRAGKELEDAAKRAAKDEKAAGKIFKTLLMKMTSGAASKTGGIAAQAAIASPSIANLAHSFAALSF